MYTTPQSGQVAAGTAAPTLHVGTYRRALLAVVIGNQYFTDAEQLRTNHNAHECQDAQRLALWTKNARRVAAEREHAQGLALMQAGIDRFEAKLAAKQVEAAAAEQPAPDTLPALPTALAQPAQVGAGAVPPVWVVLHGRITRAQRLELERRLLPQQATSYTARYLLESMGGWSAARATAEIATLGVCNVRNEVKRDLRFSVGGTMAPGLLPRRVYVAFKRVRRVVLPTHRDYQFAQPGERYDYCLGQN